MKLKRIYTRREMMRLGCKTISTIGTAAAFGQLAKVNALAQSGVPDDYRALVCIFQFGGNDSNNTVLPVSAQGYADYLRVRQSIAIPQAQLIPLAGATQAVGLHPSLAALNPMIAANKLATVLNMGTLVQPLTKDQYRSGGQIVPMNLFSHSDQQQQWQNASPRGGAMAATGWSGRIADTVAPWNVPATFPPAVGVSGNALQLIGAVTKPTTVGQTDFGFLGSDGSAAANARDASLQEMLSLDSGVLVVQGASKVLGDAVSVARMVQEATASATPLTTVFPQTGIGGQLAQVARMIQVRGRLGLKRQIFFCSQGGYDTHSTQVGTHANLLGQLGAAMAAFYNAMGELTMQDKVTLFTESEFNRTFQPNSTVGTDHAWGGHVFVLGGAVRGGVYGTMPSLALRGPDDSGDRGNWIPTLSLDQYGATLATWFGVQPYDLDQIFPNLARFTVKNIGFV